jgi:trans-aconitate 2-methyltransferase
LRFDYGRIEDVHGKWDLVWSHAAIQWIDDHVSLIPRLMSLATRGGQLAVQLPSNHGHISHVTARQLASDPPFFEALGGWTRKSPVLDIENYANLLHQTGAQDITVFEKIYPHVLESADAVANWNRGTSLLAYLERLPESLQEPFFEAYRERLRKIWPSGPVFFRFRRILLSATIT